jgi:hypothetical protein
MFGEVSLLRPLVETLVVFDMGRSAMTHTPDSLRALAESPTGDDAIILAHADAWQEDIQHKEAIIQKLETALAMLSIERDDDGVAICKTAANVVIENAALREKIKDMEKVAIEVTQAYEERFPQNYMDKYLGGQKEWDDLHGRMNGEQERVES